MQRMVSSLPGIIRSTSRVVSSSGIGQGLFWMLRTWQPCSKSPSMHWKTIVSGHHSVWRLGSDASFQTTSSGASMKACCRQLIVTHRYYGGLATLDQAFWTAWARSYTSCGRREETFRAADDHLRSQLRH